jgi:hypothetical protein
VDLLVLKHANGFFGADLAVAKAIGFNGDVAEGKVRILPGKGVGGSEVAFVGVGRLSDFRYERIQAFGELAVRLAHERNTPDHRIRTLGLTIHGPGYGLDAEQSFLSMIAGVVAELRRAESRLEKVLIAEHSERRYFQLCETLDGRRAELGLVGSGGVMQLAKSRSDDEARAAHEISNIVQFGAHAEEKARLFVAMPFADIFIDEFEIGFREAAKANDFACERLDVESFVGDIVSEIKTRILGSHGVIALLNDHNPNVFLEVGFALAHRRPTILVAKEGVLLPFDVSGHRCIRYRNISDLRKALTTEIAALKRQGVLARSA